MDKKQVTIFIQEDIHRRAKVLAAKKGTSMSAIFEMAVWDYIYKCEKEEKRITTKQL